MAESPEAESDAADQAYFHALEQIFARQRESAVLLSPGDWHVARDWRRRGVPLELVERVMGELLARRRERGARRKVSSLRYFQPAVEAAWTEVEALTAPGRRLPPEPPLVVGERLAALAAALPAGLAGRERWAERVRALAGPPETVEKELAALDAELLAAQQEALGPEAVAALETQVERTLATLRERVPAAVVEESRRGLLRQALRRQLGLPMLSLFAVGGESAGPKTSG